jgi:hypothetical protein
MVCNILHISSDGSAMRSKYLDFKAKLGTVSAPDLQRYYGCRGVSLGTQSKMVASFISFSTFYGSLVYKMVPCNYGVSALSLVNAAA